MEDEMKRKREEYIAMFTEDLRRSQAMEQQSMAQAFKIAFMNKRVRNSNNTSLSESI